MGFESLDITEIEGADVLYHEEGILAESQKNASSLFGSRQTLYSTEGATLCIRGMLAMVRYFAKEQNRNPVIFAGRNAHKSFLTGCALLDLDPIWIEDESDALLTSSVTAKGLSDFISKQKTPPTAVYLTSPDYLGNIIDVAGIAKVCHQHGALLLVDNAHGSYLHFLPDACHPLDLGADLVCDSAHKTLPVLTGGAYLHISKNAPDLLDLYAASSMTVFSSTSPSYLILESLDLCNKYLSEGYSQKLFEFSAKVVDLKKELKRLGYQLTGNEPLKITFLTKFYGYTGFKFSKILKDYGLFVEFSDPDHVVLMISPEQGDGLLSKLSEIFSKIPAKTPILSFPPKIPRSAKETTPREALLSPFETVRVSESAGRILAQPGVLCPPAIPIALCGEKITDQHVKAFQYYGIDKISVKK